jgi:hypothetical protein
MILCSQSFNSYWSVKSNKSTALKVFFYSVTYFWRSKLIFFRRLLYVTDHRVGGVLSFFSSYKYRVPQCWPFVGIGTPPPPHPQASMPPPLLVLAGVGGGAKGTEAGESKFRRGDIHCGTLDILYMYFVVLRINAEVLTSSKAMVSFMSPTLI